MAITKPAPTDIHPIARRYPNLLPLTGLTTGQPRTTLTVTTLRLPSPPGRPRGLPLSARLLLVPVHSRTHLTTGALAAPCTTSQSALDPTLHHLVAVPASSRQPDPRHRHGPWIIDGTPTRVHDQSITAPAKNYRPSITTHTNICCRHRCVVTVGQSRPGNRNHVVVSPTTVTGDRMVFGDGGYRGITTNTTPRPDQSGRTIGDQDRREHRRVRSRVEHVIARRKDRQILWQCRRRGDAINHSLHIIAGLCNLKTRTQLRAIS